MSTSQDGSESVDQFLARVASIKEGRDQASEERTRRMEEDFLKSRKERQARRLERARSLSPSKTGPSLSTPAPRDQGSKKDTALNPPVDFSPRAATLSRSNAVITKTSPTLELKQSEVDPFSVPSTTSSPSNNPAGLSRSGTLSWQQRPPRNGGTSRPRPLSTIETLRPIAVSEDEGAGGKTEPTRQEIAASLGLKDPAWFRQTQERGLGSAAFRKNQVDDTSTVEHIMLPEGLPGLSKDGTRSASETPIRKAQPSSPPQNLQLSSPPPVTKTSRALSPKPVTKSEDRELAPSPQQTIHLELKPEIAASTLGRSASIRPGRSPSPTKGLGGFVESAMMKRSDSVNKRWSVQANAGLKRGDSVAGIRPLSGVRSMHASSLSRTSNRDGSPSPAPVSRPESREGATNHKSRSATPDIKADATESQSEVVNSMLSETTSRPKTPPENQLSRSPSKTLDSRRWSPTKSSWLESALLSKADPPKPQPLKEEVPAWKATLQRNKASRDLSPDKSKLEDIAKSRGTTQDIENTSRAPTIGQNPESVSKVVSTPILMSAVGTKAAGAEQGVAVTPIKAQAAETINSKQDSPSAPVAVASLGRTMSAPEDTTEKKAPPVLKPKPQTPPKTDFRATLRSRAPPRAEGSEAEPEFKSIFGKLKRAQTQNYVAPDTLKHNILSGKAALNTTGGPQKSERVDEFKESILKKKEAMKTSAEQKKENPKPEVRAVKPDAIVPEALARRKTLHKATPPMIKSQASSNTVQTPNNEQISPAVAPKPKTVMSQMSAVSIAAAAAKEPDLKPKPDMLQDSPARKPESPKPNPVRQTLPAKEQRLNEPKPTQVLQQASAHTANALQASTTLAAVPTGLPAGSKLASRLNPNLAALLSRGSSPRSVPDSTSSSPEREQSEQSRKPVVQTASEGAAASGELTHMTKSRARGPKRRAPKSDTPKTTTPLQSKLTVTEPQLISHPETPSMQTTVKPITSLKETLISQPSAAISRPLISPRRTEVETSNEKNAPLNDTKDKPVVATKSAGLRKVSSTLSPQPAEGAASDTPGTGQFEIAADADTHVSSATPVRQTVPRTLPDIPKTGPVAVPLTPSKSRLNSSNPPQKTPDLPSKPLNPKPVISQSPASKPSTTKPTASTLQSAPTPDRPLKPSTAIKPQQRTSSSADLQHVMSTYFASIPENQHVAEFDAQALLLLAKETGVKIKTTSCTVREVNGDGKQSAMPPQQEHILFEEAMYLVLHSFEAHGGGRTSEAYLWCGDGVASAAIEDAQLFCRKDARELNAKLEVIRQGKEPSKFFQAVGGILIVRRSKSSSMYMLRGRRHLGHVVFDEVDLKRANLCSGFSYLISAKFGKLYLWKGNGSGADEVGCARLIGMDLGLTGEIEEVVDGEEPSSFWDSFTDRSRIESWSQDWQKRAEHDCYPTTLYRVEIDQGKTTGGFWGLRATSPSKVGSKAAIEVVNPFCDRDVEPLGVYVLDAYRTIYVILHPQATTKSTEVVTALHLSQELAMMSPSIQDRSLLPSCFVVFGEPPADVKVCFRKWSRDSFVKLDQPSVSIKLEDVMEALKL